MARKPLATSIDMSGPFFRSNPVKTWRENVKDFMDEIAEEGQEDVQTQLRAGEGDRLPISAGVAPARVSGHVVGRTQNLSGKRWGTTAVVSVNNRGLTRKQGIALMAAAARLEARLHVFRRTATRLRKAGKSVDLLKGLR
jgi:hypothetical protein